MQPITRPLQLRGQVVGVLQERIVRRGEVLTEQLQSALNSRILLEQAKGVISERAGIGVADAFTVMRAHARRNHLQLGAVTGAVIDGTITPSEFTPS